jgi:hypothetical protein
MSRIFGMEWIRALDAAVLRFRRQATAYSTPLLLVCVGIISTSLGVVYYRSATGQKYKFTKEEFLPQPDSGKQLAEAMKKITTSPKKNY